MCNANIKELSVKDAIDEGVFDLWTEGFSRVRKIDLSKCPDEIISTIILIEYDLDCTKQENAIVMLDTVRNHIERVQEDFEPDYISRGNEGHEAQQYLENLRLTLEYICGED